MKLCVKAFCNLFTVIPVSMSEFCLVMTRIWRNLIVLDKNLCGKLSCAVIMKLFLMCRLGSHIRDVTCCYLAFICSGFPTGIGHLLIQLLILKRLLSDFLSSYLRNETESLNIKFSRVAVFLLFIILLANKILSAGGYHTQVFVFQ